MQLARRRGFDTDIDPDAGRVAPCDQFGVNSELSMTGIVALVRVPKCFSDMNRPVGRLPVNQVEATRAVLSRDRLSRRRPAFHRRMRRGACRFAALPGFEDEGQAARPSHEPRTRQRGRSGRFWLSARHV